MGLLARPLEFGAQLPSLQHATQLLWQLFDFHSNLRGTSVVASDASPIYWEFVHIIRPSDPLYNGSAAALVVGTADRHLRWRYVGAHNYLLLLRLSDTTCRIAVA